MADGVLVVVIMLISEKEETALGINSGQPTVCRADPESLLAIFINGSDISAERFFVMGWTKSLMLKIIVFLIKLVKATGCTHPQIFSSINIKHINQVVADA